jgi:hypothetical protein
MTWTLPNVQSGPAFYGQTVCDQTDYAIIQAGINGNGVISGAQVSQDTGSDMKVAVSSGTVLYGASTYSVTATGGSPLTVAAASTSGDRRDLVVYTVGTGLVVVEGSPATTGNYPVKPSIPSSSVALGEIYVATSTTAIVTNLITDKSMTVIQSSGGASSTVVAKTANYPFVTGDTGNYFTFNGSSLVGTLPATAPTNGWHVRILNLNATEVEVTPQTLNLNGVNSPIYLSQYQVVDLYSDGTAYYYGFGTPSAGSLLTGAPPSGGVSLSAGTTTPTGLALALATGTWLVFAVGTITNSTASDSFKVQLTIDSGGTITPLGAQTGISPAFASHVSGATAMGIAVVTSASTTVGLNITPGASTTGASLATGSVGSQTAFAFRLS